MSGTRVAVVTGSNKGIGSAIVKELCSKFDGHVYLTARDEVRGKAAVQELNKLGLHPKFHQLDIDDEASVIRLRDYLKTNYGGLDVLVNNAAITSHATITDEVFEDLVGTMKTNYFDTNKACNILFPILRDHARVVNISSCFAHLSLMTMKAPGVKANEELKAKLASNLTEDEIGALMESFLESVKKGDYAERGWPTCPFLVYCVSKMAITALTRTQQRRFDQDSRQDILVNCAHPGYVDTDMSYHTGPLSPDQGAAAPSWLALLPKNADGPKGAYVWFNKEIVDWVNGPVPKCAGLDLLLNMWDGNTSAAEILGTI